jgi:hypothetical protein
MLADIADGCERPSNSTAAPQEEVESKTTDAATTSAETGTTLTKAPLRRRDVMLVSKISAECNLSHLADLGFHGLNFGARFFVADTGSVRRSKESGKDPSIV